MAEEAFHAVQIQGLDAGLSALSSQMAGKLFHEVPVGEPLFWSPAEETSPVQK
jgi:hypothetical protein